MPELLQTQRAASADGSGLDPSKYRTGPITFRQGSPVSSLTLGDNCRPPPFFFKSVVAVCPQSVNVIIGLLLCKQLVELMRAGAVSCSLRSKLTACHLKVGVLKMHNIRPGCNFAIKAHLCRMSIKETDTIISFPYDPL